MSKIRERIWTALEAALENAPDQQMTELRDAIEDYTTRCNRTVASIHRGGGIGSEFFTTMEDFFADRDAIEDEGEELQSEDDLEDDIRRAIDYARASYIREEVASGGSAVEAAAKWDGASGSERLAIASKTLKTERCRGIDAELEPRCGSCGAVLPTDRSCGCFDNGSQ